MEPAYNHALRTRPSRSGCKPRVPRAGSLSRSTRHHIYLRVILDCGPESYSANEERQLREYIASAPGVAGVTKIEPHVKGGYSVTIDRTGNVDEIFARLSAAGHRPVL